MKSIKTSVEGAFEIEPEVFGDSRGWFYEAYSKREFEKLGINADFVQDNRSFSARKGTLRGLHYQSEPKSQAKLVTCLKGEILDVAVDLRRGSPTFMKRASVVLSAENKKAFFIPKGCLHGFLTLTDDVEIEYKVDEFYSPENDGSVRFDDPEIGVEWGITDPILSEKDRNAPTLAKSGAIFDF